MKNRRKTIAVLLSLVLVLSSAFWKMPEKIMTKVSATETTDSTETVPATGPSVSTNTPAPTPANTPAATENPYGISSPVKDDSGVTTWDCVYFGKYWQNDTNGDGVADKKDDKEPVRWRVLSLYGNKAFLMADQGLDCQPYNTENANVTWETSSLRTWLNGTFYQEAFSPAEQLAVSTTTVENMEKNPQSGANFRNDTQDKVYLLSISEVGNTAYGFDSAFANESNTRCSKGTAYARAQGALISALVGSDNYTGNVWWLLRSSTYNEAGVNHTVALVGGGGGCGYSHGCAVQDSYSAVRPVLHINLSSDTWSKAGKVTSDGESTEPSPTPAPTASPSPIPTLNPTPSPAGSSQLEDQNVSPKPEITDQPAATNTPTAIDTRLKDSTGVTYIVTKSDLSEGEVVYSAPKNKKITSVTIPATVKIKNVIYKVTSIKANAFKNCKKLKKVTIGKNIKTIGKNAFYGCSKLNSITIKTTKLTNKNVGSNAFAKLHKKAQCKVPKKKLSAYKKLLKKKGVTGKKQIIKK